MAIEKPKELTIDEKFINQLVAEAEEYVFDSAKVEVRDALTNTKNTGEAVGATTYKITKGLLDKYKGVGLSLEADMGHALALGTEVTDMLVETIEAIQPDAVMDGDKLREEGLLRATVMHGEDVEKRGDPAEKEEAQVMYAQMISDGTADQGMEYVNKKSRELGLNTNDMMRTGVEQGNKYLQDTLQARNPLAEGIQQSVQNKAPLPPQPEVVPDMQAQGAPPPPQPANQMAQQTPPQAGPEGAVMGGPPASDPMAGEQAPPQAPLMGAV